MQPKILMILPAIFLLLNCSKNNTETCIEEDHTLSFNLTKENYTEYEHVNFVVRVYYSDIDRTLLINNICLNATHSQDTVKCGPFDKITEDDHYQCIIYLEDVDNKIAPPVRYMSKVFTGDHISEDVIIRFPEDTILMERF